MKTLKTIQTLSKIGKILSKIVFICCIVGFCLCAAGILSLALGGASVQLGGVTLHGLIGNQAGMETAGLYASMIVGMLSCAAEAVVSRFAVLYFEHELQDGTPFTLRGAKELMRLGILAAAVPLGMSIVCAVGVGIARHFVSGIGDVQMKEYASIGTGIALLMGSLLCRCGAEATAQPPQDAEKA